MKLSSMSRSNSMTKNGNTKSKTRSVMRFVFIGIMPLILPLIGLLLVDKYYVKPKRKKNAKKQEKPEDLVE